MRMTVHRAGCIFKNISPGVKEDCLQILLQGAAVFTLGICCQTDRNIQIGWLGLLVCRTAVWIAVGNFSLSRFSVSKSHLDHHPLICILHYSLTLYFSTWSECVQFLVCLVSDHVLGEPLLSVIMEADTLLSSIRWAHYSKQLVPPKLCGLILLVSERNFRS